MKFWIFLSIFLLAGAYSVWALKAPLLDMHVTLSGALSGAFGALTFLTYEPKRK